MTSETPNDPRSLVAEQLRRLRTTRVPHPYAVILGDIADKIEAALAAEQPRTPTERETLL